MKLPIFFSNISLTSKERYLSSDLNSKMEQNPPQSQLLGRRRMKVLFITRKYPPAKGGMETLSYNVTTRFPGDKKIIALRKKNQMHLVWFLPFCFLYLIFHSRKFKIVHFSDMVLIILGWWAKILNKKIKVAINVHGLDINFAERKNILAKLYRLYLKFLGKDKNYDLLICNSQNTEKICQQYNFSKTIVIPLGIELPTARKFTRTDLFKIIGDQHQNKKYLLTVGRLIKRKGVNWFIQNVLPLLNQEIIYLVAGETSWMKTGDNELDLIKKSIKEKGLEKRVLLLGKVSNEYLEILYQTVDFYIMPNIPVEGDSEGFGIVALEASSHGLPVIASKLEGIIDAILDGKNGFLIPAMDAKAFKEKIDELLQNDLTDLRNKVKEFTLMNYSWDNIIKRYQLEFGKLWQEKK